MTTEQQEKIEQAAKKLANEYCYPDNEIIDITRSLIHEYIYSAYIAGAEFALNNLCEVAEKSGQQSHHYQQDDTTAMNCRICGQSKFMHNIKSF